MAVDFSRFLSAQTDAFASARAELVAGVKTSHWMWYIFPQLAALGHSTTARYYGIEALADAREYEAHPVLGQRLTEVTRIVLRHRGKTPRAIFGSPDDLKFRSSMTLFALAAPQNAELRQAIAAFYDGPDQRTLDLLGLNWQDAWRD